MNGKLVIFSAPSGTGKTTIVKQILERGLPFEFSISACTRLPRNGEKPNIDYYFLTPEKFRKYIEEEKFIEWEEVYPGQYYGTLKSEIDRIWDKGKNVIFDIDVKGGIRLKEMFKEKALSLFIKPPSIIVLESRLRNRGTDDETSIKKRIDKAEYEISFAQKFDCTIVNDDLDIAVNETYNNIKLFLEQK